MDKLSQLRISNFRGIRNLNLDNFEDINIIIGQNNTCKSTILEGIYLNSAGSGVDLWGNDPLFHIFSNRGLTLPKNTNAMASFLFYLGQFDIPAKFISDKNEYTIRLVETLSSKIRSEIESEVIKGISRRLSVTLNQTEAQLNEIEYDVNFALVDNNDNLLYSVLREYIPEKNVKIKRIFPRNIFSSQNRSKLRNKVILLDMEMINLNLLTKRTSTFRAILKRIDPHTQKIDVSGLTNFISDQINKEVIDVIEKLTDFYIRTKDGDTIPMSLLGDGTKRSIILYYILSLEDSIILLEEPENYLHPRLMQKVSDLIIESSKMNQIFITTHSIDLIRFLTKKAKQRNQGLNIYSITNKENLEVRIYGLDEVNTAVNEIGVDIR